MTAQAAGRGVLDLSGVPEAELERVLRVALERDDAEAAQILTAEFGRRDAEAKSARKREAAAKRRAAHQAKQAEWRDAAWAQYERASEECRGRLLSRAGMEAAKRWQSDEFLLWSLSARDAERCASEELNDFWRGAGGRLTFGRWNSLHSAAADRRRWEDEQRWAQADTSEQDAAAEPGAGLTVWTVWRNTRLPLPDSRHVVVEGAGEQARQAAEAYAREVWGWEAEQVSVATTVTADAARALHERQKAEAAGIAPGQGGGGAGGGDERRIQSTPPAQEATIHAAGEDMPPPPADVARDPAEDAREARRIAGEQRAERTRERAVQGAALTGRPMPAAPAPRGGGACRHPERPGNGKRMCGDCPRRRAGAAGKPGTELAVIPRAGVARAQQEAPIDGDRLLRQVHGFLGHFAVWPTDATLIAAALWTAQANARDPETLLPAWEYSPRWLFLSSEPGSGKSWMARLMVKMCPGGQMLVEPTKASLVQTIYEHGTPALDETDILFGTGQRNAGIRAILNAGYEPDQHTSHMQGRQKVPVPLFGPVILGGLDKLKYATGNDMKALLSRCLIAHVKMAPAGYRPPRFGREARAVASALGGRLARWMAQQVDTGIGGVVPDVPDGLGNRPAALWEPLFSVADAAGGEWPEMARYACQKMEAQTGLPDEDEDEAADVDGLLDGWALESPGGLKW